MVGLGPEKKRHETGQISGTRVNGAGKRTWSEIRGRNHARRIAEWIAVGIVVGEHLGRIGKLLLLLRVKGCWRIVGRWYSTTLNGWKLYKVQKTCWKRMKSKKYLRTFLTHADFDALFESAVLALIAMVLVDWTIPVASARVGQVPSDGSLEEAFTTFTRELTVMFSRTFVSTNDAFDKRLFQRFSIVVVGGRRARIVVVVVNVAFG